MTNSPIPGDVVARPTPKEAAENLRGHARKRNLWPGDNDFDDAAAIIDRQSDLIEALQFDVGKYKSRLETVFAEKEALQRELAGTQGALNEMAEELQVICEKHGALGGDRRTAFIGAKLDELQSQASSARQLALEALEPFAALAEKVATGHPGWDHDHFAFISGSGFEIPFAPFRRARAAIRDIKGADSRAEVKL